MEKQTKEQYLKARELNNKQIISVIAALLIFLAVGILIGVPIGMMIQQALLIEGFEQMAPTLEKINVDIGLNETFLVEETKRVAMAVLDIQQQRYNNQDNRIDLGVGYLDNNTQNCTGVSC